MNYNAYLNFIYKAIEKNQIKENSKIVKFKGKYEVEDSNIYKKKIELESHIVPINIENKLILLMDDLPINFLISHTILIGENSRLLKFKLKKKEEYYISTREIYEKIKENVEKQTLSNFNPKELFNKKFKYEFEQVKLIKDLKEYLSSIKKINFNKIHITNSDKIENFLPTIKQDHFTMAKKMNIPIIQLFEDGYIKDSSIHIKDNIRHNQIINSLLNYKKEFIWDFDKRDDEKLFKDLSYKIIFYPDFEEIESILEKNKNNNLSNDIILNEIKKYSKIILNSQNGRYVLPIWKSHNTQEFLGIKDTKNFLEISGVKFQDNMDILNGIYLQTERGEKALFKNQFLNPKIEKYFINLSIDDKEIYYNEFEELIFKLKISTNPDKIIKIEKIPENQINELKKSIKFIIKKLVLITIKNNKIPSKNNSNQEIDIYLKSVSASLYIEYEKFIKKENKKNLLKFAIQKSHYLINLLHSGQIQFENLYNLIQCILVLLKILEKINPKSAKEILKYFKEYFKEDKFKIYKNKQDLDIEKLLEDLIIINKLAEKKEVIIVEKIKIPPNLINKKVIKNKNIPIIKKYLKFNNNKLKQIFPYRYNLVKKELSNLNANNIRENEAIYLENLNIKIDSRFISKFEIYKYHKFLLENNYFKALVKKINT
jgi:hypothetical protein